MSDDKKSLLRASVSVVIPVYNADDYLEKCLESILNQSYDNIEVIVVDDGSKDGSLALARNMAKKDKRVKVIERSNSGVSTARNVGIEYANGKYILFVDADDYISEELISSCVERLERGICDVVMFNIFFEDLDLGILEFYPDKKRTVVVEDAINDFVASEFINSPCNKMYKTSIIRSEGICFDTGLKIAEDLLFNWTYFKYCTNAVVLDSKLYFYRRSNSQSATSKPMSCKYGNLMEVNNRMLSDAGDFKSDKLISILKYIRVKNILSCIKDLCIYKGISKSEAMKIIKKYKKENHFIFIRDIGLTKMLYGFAYSLLPCRLLYLVVYAVTKKGLNR